MPDPNVPPQFAGAAQSALAGLPDESGPQQAPPSPAPVAPAPQPTFFGRLLQGALNGLAGGLKQGQENIAGAGTTGFTPGGNGLAYAQQMQNQQDAQARQQQQDKQAQSQQDFENQSKQFQMAQQQQMQKVQTVQAKLAGIQLEQNDQHAEQEVQDKYYAGMEQHRQDIIDAGGKEVTTLKVGQGQDMKQVGADYLKEHPEVLNDPAHQITFSRDPDGETEVHILKGDPNAPVDNKLTQSRLKSVGSDLTLPDGQMTALQASHLVGQESSKAADQHHQVQMENLKAQNESKLESQRQAGQVSLEKMKEGAANFNADGGDPTKPLDSTLERLVDAVHNGDATPAQVTKGMGTKAVAGNRAMQARYEAKYMDPKSPDYDPQAQSWQGAEGNYKAAYNDKNTQNVQNAGTLLGTVNPKTGAVVTRGSVADMKAKMQHLQAQHPELFSSGPVARGVAHLAGIAGNSVAEDIMASAPDIALDYAKFASGGNPSSDAQFKAVISSIQRARTPEALKAVFDGLDDMAGQRIAGFKQNPALARRLANIKDPGTNNDVNNTPLNAGTSSGQKRVSIDKALQLPAFQGKSRAEVQKAIEAQGHTAY